MRIKIIFFYFFVILLNSLFSNALVSIYKYDGKYGLIDSDFNIVEQNKFSSFIQSGDFLILKSSSFFYVYNKFGEVEMSFKAVTVKPVMLNIILVSDFEKSYYVDLLKKQVVEDNLVLSEGMKIISNDLNDFEIRDSVGNVIKDNLLECGNEFSEGFLPVKDFTTKTGFIDKSGNFVFECPIYGKHAEDDPKIHPIYDFEFSGGLVCVPQSSNSFAIYDKTGKKIKTINGMKLEHNKFTNNYILVSVCYETPKKFAFLNSKGENSFGEFFKEATSFVNGYAMIVKDEKDALINVTGKTFFCAEFFND